ncbi:MAG: anaerobic ribonucleoside-triphosphate reductase activating protein [Spirochaetaceae bacterium]|jgi:pyruvate formate lyase activating enzyme|nr:anaerobic ribonucleoside-triphosphate reductase activating protein [Spirochaetaceae bacterium]GMO31117.1 MAG: anaerobic ribonucleoside-triphosphate reductase activating protein [Termitinemataceae bacterium]
MNTKVFFRKTTLVDYPEKVAAAIFFSFCNLRCPWCHNGDLISGKAEETLVTLDEALAHIEKRANLIDGVVISGGEPTLFSELAQLIARIKSFSLDVKLDTNGTKPEVLSALLEEAATTPSYIAMDLKFSPESYIKILAAPSDNSESNSKIKESIVKSAAILREAYKAGKTKVEFRSLVLPHSMFNKADIAALKELAGAVPWNIRGFVPGNCLDSAWNDEAQTSEIELKKIMELI